MAKDTLRTNIVQLTGKGKVHLSVRAKDSLDRGERVGEQSVLYFQVLEESRLPSALRDYPVIAETEVLEQVLDRLRYQLEIAWDHSSMIPY